VANLFPARLVNSELGEIPENLDIGVIPSFPPCLVRK
jgi:hypothetical protein